MIIAERTEEIVDLREQLAAMEARHLDERESLAEEISDAESKRAHEAAGTSEQELKMARHLVEVKWVNDRPEYLDEQVIQDAVEDLATGCLTLRSEYFARRHYEANTHRETYSYGMGPKHGNVVFAVGLTDSALTFFRKWKKVPEGENGDSVNAAIRYLLGLKEAGQP